MKVGVTGASGFIGRHLVKALSDSEHEVFKFVRRDPKNMFRHNENFKYFYIILFYNLTF